MRGRPRLPLYISEELTAKRKASAAGLFSSILIICPKSVHCPTRFPDPFGYGNNLTAAVEFLVGDNTDGPANVQNLPQMFALANIKFRQNMLGCTPTATVVQKHRDNLSFIHKQFPLQWYRGTMI